MWRKSMALAIVMLVHWCSDIGVSWRISSCFDCRLLKERTAGGYYCQGFNVRLSYDIARTVNDCPKKIPFEEQKSGRAKVLDDLYQKCCEYAVMVLGPFTARELVVVTQFQNKNSLWQMLEDLVRQGRLNKGKMRIANRYGHTYRSNVYFPVWRQDSPNWYTTSGQTNYEEAVTHTQESLELLSSGCK
jgi:hypothetical protein